MKQFLLLFVFSIISLSAFAQTNPPDGGSGSGTVNDVPLDGGLTLLVAGAVAYGIKHKKKHTK